MDISSVNHRALKALEDQDYMQAQSLFYQNAICAPTHGTLHNLGYYLCTEGLICRNGQWRSACALGLRYIEKAAKEKQSALNYRAQATAMYLQSRGASLKIKQVAYERIYEVLLESLKLQYDAVTLYNKLSFAYILGFKCTEMLVELRKLVDSYPSQESITLYLYALCKHGAISECLLALQRQEVVQVLDTLDLMVLYYYCGCYEKSADFFESISKTYSLNKSEASILIDSLVRAGRTEDKHMFFKDRAVLEKTGIGRAFCKNICNATAFREQFIKQYTYTPPYVTPCGYFGCEMHKTEEII